MISRFHNKERERHLSRTERRIAEKLIPQGCSGFEFTANTKTEAYRWKADCTYQGNRITVICYSTMAECIKPANTLTFLPDTYEIECHQPLPVDA